ncbi:MAG: alpha/beta fold hydrolase, partial [Candidatus Riflebacteria bacterium]|nr:alpha/beta fold hydrolase [Candidatus Riflebacteria bacterium]
MTTTSQSTSRQSIENTYPSRDGTQLFYRAWIPEKPRRGAMLLFHRGHEHSGRWQETVDTLGLDDLPVFAWDARGHGRSPGERGWASDLATVISDVDAFVKWISSHHGIPVEEMTVVATSVGAVIVSAWVHDYAPKIRALVLAVPAFRVRLYVPFAIELLRLRQVLLGPGFVKSYVKGRMLTHDPVEAQRYAEDPLIFPQIAVNMLLDLFDTSTRLIADAGAIDVPTLVLVAGSDWVVSQDAQHEFYDRLSSPVKRLVVLPGFYHAIFHEKERHLVVEKIREFFLDPEVEPRKRAFLLDADRRGYTHDEFERLRGPGSFVYTLLRWVMATVGRLSQGIRLGLESGFDSGVMLDYVYENRA